MPETLTAPMPTKVPATPTRARVSRPTETLLFIASESPALRDIMGIEFPERSGEIILSVRFKPNFHRPWLVPHPRDNDVLTFDAKIFHLRRAVSSTGQAHMIDWIVNVWNPQLARANDWTFDLFRALQSLDEANREAIATWLNNGAEMP